MTGSEFAELLIEVSEDIEADHGDDDHSAKWWLQLLKEKLDTGLRGDDDGDDDDEQDDDKFGDTGD